MRLVTDGLRREEASGPNSGLIGRNLHWINIAKATAFIDHGESLEDACGFIEGCFLALNSQRS